MTGIVATVLLLGLAFCVFVNTMVYLSVKKLENPDGLLVVRDGGAETLSTDPTLAFRAEWAAANGFAPDIRANFHGAVGGEVLEIAVWKSSYKKTFLSTYTAQGKVCCEFVTILEDDQGLTTSNMRDSLLIPPRPGSYTQAFDGLDLDRLSAEHEAALVFLHEHKGTKIVERWESTETLILDAVRQQMEYVQTIPLWQFRGIFWYLVRRYALNGKRVADRYRD